MATDLDVRGFGAGFVPSATATQNSDTLQAAIDWFQANPNPGWTGANSGHTIWIPAGIWLMGKQIRIFRPIRLVGAGSSFGATRLEWVEAASTWDMWFGTMPNPISAPPTPGDLKADSSAILICGKEAEYFSGNVGSNGAHFVMENITIASHVFHKGAIRRGITIRAPCRLVNVEVGNFSENGIHVEGKPEGAVWKPDPKKRAFKPDPSKDGVAYPSNAGGCAFYDVESIANGGHGFFATGSDANVCVYVRCRGVANRGAQFCDNTLHGSTYVMCQADGAGGDWGFYADRGTSPTGTAFVGCYNESSAPSYFTGAIHVFGGAIGLVTPNSEPGSMRTHGDGGYAIAKPEVYASNFFPYWNWYAKHRYKVGDFVYSPDKVNSETGHLFSVVAVDTSCGREGRSDSVEPLYVNNLFKEPPWDRAINGTTPDGDVTWKCVAEYTNKNPTLFMPGGFITPPTLSNPYRSAYAFGEFTRGSGVLSHYELVNGVDFRGRWAMYWGASRIRLQKAYDLTDEGATYPRRGAFVLPEVFVGDFDVNRRFYERRFYVSYDGLGGGGRIPFQNVGDFVTNATWSAASPAQPWAWRVRQPGALPPSTNATGYTTRTDNTEYNVGDCVVDPSSPGNVFRCIVKGRSGAAPPSWNITDIGKETKEGGDDGCTWVYHGSAHEVIEPLPRQADTQADLTAADIASLRADFNSLLQKLRDAHIIAT